MGSAAIPKCASGMMADVRVLDGEPVKPFESLEGTGRMGLDLAKYMAEHIYMYSSVNARCRFRVARAMISDVIDMFGANVVFSDETDKRVAVSARVNERAMWQFAKNFAPDVLILEPKHLVDQVRAEAERTLAAYRELM
ncbi:WYL domain-containing protein [Ellagibacter isourolithinifaciens]|uniref:WYL domain-containing protein n=1 Tax=Ellagibacter isourolithinifaciens TaxID=2137581 RepID=UPI003A9478E3